MIINPIFEPFEPITLHDYMTKCGVKNIEEYLSAQYVEPWSNYTNAFEMAQDINNAIKMGDNFYIIVDPDDDGLLTAVIQIIYLLKCEHLNNVILMHDKFPKAHGLEDEQIMGWLIDNAEQGNLGTIWIGDAGTSNTEQCKVLSDLGYSVRITDHHSSSQDNPYALIVNNQLSDKVTNKQLSGCGVTFKILQAIDYINDTKYARELISFVHFTNISDSCGFTNSEQHTFRHWGNLMIYPTLKPFIDAFNYKGGLDNMDYSFGAVSRFNAVIRIGTLEQKELLLRALSQGGDITEAIEICKKCKTEQDKIRDDLLENNITIELDSNIVVGKIDVSTPLTGLIANKLMSKYNKPIFLVHETESGEVKGSCRSTIPIRELCEDSRLFNFAQGHDCSFGVSWQKDSEEDIYSWIASLTLSEPNIATLGSWTTKSIPKYLFSEFGANTSLYGQGMKEPLVHIHSITVNQGDIREMGANGRTLKLSKDGIDFMWFMISNEDKKALLNTPYELELVGIMGVNEWNGRKTPQIIVEKYEIKDLRKKTLEDIF